jgi:drug/metabolite transporter (DMT)-like permease
MPRAHPATTAAILLVGATLFWAGNYVVGEQAVRSIPPLSLTYLRWVIAAIPLLAIAQAVERPAWGDVLRRWPTLLVLGAIGLGGYPLVVYLALRHTSALNASLINAFNPTLIVVAAAVFLRERASWRGVAGLMLGLLGVVLVLTRGHLAAILRTQHNPGDLLMLLAIVLWTAYTILGRRIRGVPPVAATAVQAVLTVVLLTPIAIHAGVTVPTTRGPLLSLLFIALFPSVLAYLMWNSAVRHVEAGRAGIFLNLIAVFAAVASLAMGRPIALAQVIGGALVIAGVCLSSTARIRP